MDFPEVISGNIFNIGQMFLNIKFSESNTNWIFAPFLCILVGIEFLIIQSYLKSNKKIPLKYINLLKSDKFGCWLIVILPLILYYHKSYSDFLTILIGSVGGLIFHCLLNGAYFATFASTIVWLYLIYTVYNLSILSTIIFPIFLTSILSKTLPSFFVDTFLLGESLLLSQIISLFMIKSIYTSIFIIYYLSLERLTHINQYSATITIFITFFFSIWTYYLCLFFKKNVINDIYELAIIILSVKHLILIFSWLFLLLLCLFLVYIYNNTSKSIENDESSKCLKDRIIHSRKVFHFATSFVFITASVFNAIVLVNMCSVLLLVGMLFMEHIRRKQIGAMGKVLQALLVPFFDKRDKGTLVLSPIGLLCGISLPFWISSLYESYWSTTDRFWLCSGVISVGVGDSFAALIGRRYGRYFWNYKLKDRTLEGSLACFVSQSIACIILFMWFNIPFSELCIQRAFLAVVTTTFIEAHTCQLDNFVLPLVFYSFQ